MHANKPCAILYTSRTVYTALVDEYRPLVALLSFTECFVFSAREYGVTSAEFTEEAALLCLVAANW